MTSTEKRLESAGAALTVRERLTLVMRAWLNDEPWDERLVRHVPPEQREEYERLSSVVEDGNLNLPQTMAFELAWLRQLELEASRLDLDCGDIPFRRFTVLPQDPHRFDGSDNDGVGCESYSSGAAWACCRGMLCQWGSVKQRGLATSGESRTLLTEGLGT